MSGLYMYYIHIFDFNFKSETISDKVAQLTLNSVNLLFNYYNSFTITKLDYTYNSGKSTDYNTSRATFLKGSTIVFTLTIDNNNFTVNYVLPRDIIYECDGFIDFQFTDTFKFSKIVKYKSS